MGDYDARESQGTVKDSSGGLTGDKPRNAPLRFHPVTVWEKLSRSEAGALRVAAYRVQRACATASMLPVQDFSREDVHAVGVKAGQAIGVAVDLTKAIPGMMNHVPVQASYPAQPPVPEMRTPGVRRSCGCSESTTPSIGDKMFEWFSGVSKSSWTVAQ